MGNLCYHHCISAGFGQGVFDGILREACTRTLEEQEVLPPGRARRGGGLRPVGGVWCALEAFGLYDLLVRDKRVVFIDVGEREHMSSAHYIILTAKTSLPPRDILATNRVRED